MEVNFDLDQEISEHPWDPVLAANQPDAHPTVTRGRSRLPELWTRVISVHHDDLSTIKLATLADDLKLAKGFPSSIMGNITGQWRPLFHPRKFAEENPMMSLDRFRLSFEELKEQAELVTQLRDQVTQRALQFDFHRRRSLRADLQKVDRLAERVQRWNTITRQRDNDFDAADWVEETPPQLRQKIKNRPKLKNTEILEIAHKAIVAGDQQNAIAKEYRVSSARVSQIVRKVKANRHVLEEMREADVQKRDRRSSIKQVIEQMVQQTDHVSCADEVRWILEHNYGVDVKRWEIYKILKEDLNMSYRKITQAAVMGNSVRNLVLRQQWALQFFRLASQGKHFMNIDETWLNQAEFRRQKWRSKDTTNSVSVAIMAPRISVIACLNSFGEVYLCLTQSNTNDNIMEIYLHQLCNKLDREKPGWREHFVIFLDGASYHQSSSILRVMETLQLPILLVAPHGYSASPIELFFSLLKRTNLNEYRLPLGKKDFANVVQIVMNRVQQLDRRTLILLFHHCLQKAFEYLVYKPL